MGWDWGRFGRCPGQPPCPRLPQCQPTRAFPGPSTQGLCYAGGGGPGWEGGKLTPSPIPCSHSQRLFVPPLHPSVCLPKTGTIYILEIPTSFPPHLLSLLSKRAAWRSVKKGHRGESGAPEPLGRPLRFGTGALTLGFGSTGSLTPVGRGTSHSPQQPGAPKLSPTLGGPQVCPGPLGRPEREGPSSSTGHQRVNLATKAAAASSSPHTFTSALFPSHSCAPAEGIIVPGPR